MTVLVFLSAAARARIIPSNVLFNLNRGVGLLLPVGGKVGMSGLEA